MRRGLLHVLAVIWLIYAQISVALARVPTEPEVRNLVTLCGAGLDRRVQATLVARITGFLKSANGGIDAGGSFDEQTFAAVIATKPEDQQIDLRVYHDFVSCIIKETEGLVKESSTNSLTELSLRAEAMDSRGRSTSGPLHFVFNKTYARGQERAAGGAIAEAVINHLKLMPHTASFKVSLLNQAGKLTIQDQLSGGFASLHVTRFKGIATLDQLWKQFDAHSNDPAQMPVYMLLPNAPMDPADFDLAVRAGVYRVAVVAPFYSEVVIYVQLSNQGGLFVPENGGSESKLLTLPFDIILRRSGAPLRIGLAAVRVVSPEFPGTEFSAEAQALEDGFSEAIATHTDYEYVAGGSAVYDPGRRKGYASNNPELDVAVGVEGMLLPENN